MDLGSLARADAIEAWSVQGSRSGVLTLHGFTGSPASMRPLAEALAADGFSVELPRLPGHGTTPRELNRTRWQDWSREARAALEILAARTDRRIIVGLSMGGLLAAHLAAQRPDLVDGIVVVNPALVLHPHPLLRLVPLLRFLLPSYPAPARDDIARPGVTERGYDRIPLAALHSLQRLQATVDLEAVTCPVLALTSRTDHVVDPDGSAALLRRVAAVDRTQVWLERSLHVATLDLDADEVHREILAFAARLGAAPHADR